jgi:hypothetical protein
MAPVRIVRDCYPRLYNVSKIESPQTSVHEAGDMSVFNTRFALDFGTGA